MRFLSIQRRFRRLLSDMSSAALATSRLQCLLIWPLISLVSLVFTLCRCNALVKSHVPRSNVHNACSFERSAKVSIQPVRHEPLLPGASALCNPDDAYDFEASLPLNPWTWFVSTILFNASASHRSKAITAFVARRKGSFRGRPCHSRQKVVASRHARGLCESSALITLVALKKEKVPLTSISFS